MANMEDLGWWIDATTVCPFAAKPLSVDTT